jgi:hypothetical protein
MMTGISGLDMEEVTREWRILHKEDLYNFYSEKKYIFFLVVRQPLMGQGLLIVEVSRSHSDTAHSVGLLCTSDQLVAETST